MMNRRSFIKTLSATGLALQGSLWGLSSMAQALETNNNHFFVMIRMLNGWDVTLNMDPQIHKNGSTQEDMFIEYSPSSILRYKNLSLGPALAPLKNHFQDIATINGILMNTDDNGHDSSLNYISTGEGSGKAPSLPVEVAHAYEALPLGVVFSGNLKRANRAVATTSTNSILNIKNLSQIKAFQGFLDSTNRSTDLSDSMKALMNNTTMTNNLIQYLSINETAMQSSTSEELKAAQLVAGCFLVDASRCAQIDFNTFELDSHSGHEKMHLDAQTAAWQKISDIFSLFKQMEYQNSGKSLFDMTTFAVVSEFSRTPALNASKGKDHNPLTNSVLLAGRNIIGGQTVGASHLIQRKQSKSGQPKHVSLPINYATGEVALNRKQAESSQFDFITPDRVAATIASAVGVDADRFKSADLSRPILPLIARG